MVYRVIKLSETIFECRFCKTKYTTEKPIIDSRNKEYIKYYRIFIKDYDTLSTWECHGCGIRLVLFYFQLKEEYIETRT